jgi:imidazolonepropionase-like amidohydrolase
VNLRLPVGPPAPVLVCALLLLSGGAAGSQTPTSLVIRGAAVIDGTGGPALANATVVIEGNRIGQVTTQNITPPAGARVIDAAGKYLIPGLMDMHVHLRGGGGRRSGEPVTAEQERAGIQALHSYLYAGVTTIYDAGNRAEFIFGLREQERGGAIVSPRIFATGGTVASSNGHGGPFTVEAWPQDRAKLDEHIASGPDILKIGQDEHGWGTRPLINQLPEDLLEKIIRYYHAQGIRTTIHVSNERNAIEAIYAGIDTLAHPIIQAPMSEAYVRMMSVKRVPTVSTLTIGESYSRLADHPEYLDQPLYRDTIDPEEIRRLRTEESAKQRENRWAWWMKVMTPVAQENMRRLNEAGKDIVVCGTDQSSGPAVHRELELLVEGGITPAEAIVIATRNAARFLGRLDDMGTIEKGKLADLVLLRGDPTADIDNAKLIDTVIKDGRIVDRSKLDLPVNRRPQTSQEPAGLP